MNILSLIENQLSPQTIGPISNAIGETPEATKSALGAAVPGLLGSLLGKVGTSPNGAADLFNILKQGKSQGAWPESMGDVTNALSSGTPPAGAQSLLGSLLGSKLGPVSDFIASHAGIKSGSAMSLLGMAAPLLMGTLSKQVSSQNVGAAGLGQLLSSQIPYVKDAIPPGLASTLGINNLLSGREKMAASTAQSAYREAAPAGGGILKWAWVPILLALLGWFFASRTHRTPEVGGTVETNANMTATGHGYGNIDFSSLNLAPGGMADNLAKAISSGDWNKTIELQGVTDSAGAVTDSAKAGIGEIGRVLSAAPNAKVQITGHGATDEAGLSQADSIKSALISTGISEDRISATGQAGSGVPTINLMH
jgi:OOP family OmpA-OmpF porin